MAKILVLGATGAMATYLVPELICRGDEVVGVSLDAVTSDEPLLTYVRADAKDKAFLSDLVMQGFDAIVDFMVYNTVELFREYFEIFRQSGAHYVFLSTYRVYAGEKPISENSLRILDMERPSDFVTEREYSIYKAEEENMLHLSGYEKYTIVRPAVTYSSHRFQLTTLEANVLIYRMLRGKTVVLPESAMDHEATMSWAGDVAKMLSALILNRDAYGGVFTVSTAEHHTWREIAEIYKKLGGLKYITASDDDYLEIFGGGVYARQQLLYDRCYDRVIDNTRILHFAGMSQKDLMPLEEGLKLELSALTEERIAWIGCDKGMNERMDAYLEKIDNSDK